MSTRGEAAPVTDSDALSLNSVENRPEIRYRPVRSSTRKGAHERTVGHEWRCMGCNEIIHEEPILGFDCEETEDEASARHLRIKTSCAKHECKLKTSIPVGSGDEDDPNLPPEDE